MNSGLFQGSPSRYADMPILKCSSTAQEPLLYWLLDISKIAGWDVTSINFSSLLFYMYVGYKAYNE